MNNIPKYPDSRKITISDHATINLLLKEGDLDISDYNFTNIFTWRSAYGYRISELNGMIITSGTQNGNTFFLPPIGDLTIAAETVTEIFNQNKKEKPFMAVCPEWLANELREKKELKVVSDRANWDYIHKSKALAHLKGQKYHSKRNLIKQFTETYKIETEPLTPALCKEAMDYSDKWCQQRDCESNKGLKQEKCAIFQMLTHFEVLDLHGLIVRVDGEISGLTLGEGLNSDTYVVHVEKGDKHLRGIYQFINQRLAKNVEKDFKWINREQDLGIQGLRRAKKSYYPHHFVKKYKIEAK